MRTRVAGVFQALERVTGHDITLMRAVGGPASAPEFLMGMSSTLGSLPAMAVALRKVAQLGVTHPKSVFS